MSDFEKWFDDNFSGDYLHYEEQAWDYQQEKINHQKKIIKELIEENEKLKYITQYTYDTCLCKRFKTSGFDYHEQHPNRDKNNGGKRPFTPKVNIENVIGFEWKYESEKVGCKSWKELKFKNSELIKDYINEHN